MNNYSKNNLKNYKVIRSETNNKINKYYDESYNCGGFALNNFDWVLLNNFSCPRAEAFEIFEKEYGEQEEYDIEEDENYLEILEQSIEECAQSCVKELLEDYPIRQIESVDELKDNEYAFCFRVGASDFHFIRRFTNGQWAHKRGEYPIEEINEKEVFSESWPHYEYPYCSTIYLFACES